MYPDCSENPGVAAAPGSSLFFGPDRRTSALDETLVNGTAPRAFEFNAAPGGYHSVLLVPMLFALAEERKGRGDDLIVAYVIGVETEMRLARAVNACDDENGDSARMLGVFATAASASSSSSLVRSGRQRHS